MTPRPDALPPTMTAVTLDGHGGPEVLTLADVATPIPAPGEVLVKVAAAGVNRPDIHQRKGHYPPPPGHSAIPGLEVAGEVAAVGAGVTRVTVGERVMALVNGGGYAAYCAAPEGSVLRVPEGMALVEAAAIPETFFTVWHNVFERGGLKAGEWLLVHGGTSGIGVTAIQLAKAFGARVIATAGSAAKCQACGALGADRAVDYTAEDFVAAAKEATGGRGMDLILDMVGGDYVDRNIQAAAEDGRIVNIAFLKGGRVTADLQRAMVKRLTLTGSTLRPRTNAVKAGLARAIEEKALPLVTAGRVRIVIDRRFPLAEVREAHALMEASTHIGKIVLTLG